MIDWIRVGALRDEVGEEDFDEVVDLFLAETSEALDQLADTPADQAEELLHFLKGSALTLGFSDFATLCQSAETGVLQCPPQPIDLAAITHSYAASKDAFLTQLPDVKAA